MFIGIWVFIGINTVCRLYVPCIVIMLLQSFSNPKLKMLHMHLVGAAEYFTMLVI